MDCSSCGMEMENEETKWLAGECLCEDCYIFEKGYNYAE